MLADQFHCQFGRFCSTTASTSAISNGNNHFIVVAQYLNAVLSIVLC